MKKDYQKLLVVPIEVLPETGLMTQSVVTMKSNVTVESYENHEAFGKELPSEWGDISF